MPSAKTHTHDLASLTAAITQRHPELEPILDTIIDDLTQPQRSGEDIRHALEHLFDRQIDLHETDTEHHYRWSNHHDHIIELTLHTPNQDAPLTTDAAPSPPPPTLIHHTAPILKRHNLHLILISSDHDTITAVLTPQAKPGHTQLPTTMLTGTLNDLETQITKALNAITYTHETSE